MLPTAALMLVSWAAASSAGYGEPPAAWPASALGALVLLRIRRPLDVPAAAVLALLACGAMAAGGADLALSTAAGAAMGAAALTACRVVRPGTEPFHLADGVALIRLWCASVVGAVVSGAVAYALLRLAGASVPASAILVAMLATGSSMLVLLPLHGSLRGPRPRLAAVSASGRGGSWQGREAWSQRMLLAALTVTLFL